MDKDKNNVSEELDDDAEKSVEKADSKKLAPKKKPKVTFKERIMKALREYRSELKKIVWYNREQTFKSSVIVIISVVIVSAFIGGLDYVFSTTLMWLGKLV